MQLVEQLKTKKVKSSTNDTLLQLERSAQDIEHGRVRKSIIRLLKQQ